MPRDSEPAAVAAGRRAGRAAIGGKIATANRLRDGVVVYWSVADAWDTEVERAQVAHTPEDEEMLKAALATGVRENRIVDAAVIELGVVATKPARLREQIRAVGPTIRPDLARRKNW